MKANQDNLNELHGMVTQVLVAQLGYREPVMTIDEDGNMTAGEELRYTAAPATLAAAIKMLKDNNTTADVEQDENLTNLRDMLKKKQKHSRVSGKDAANVIEM